MRDELVSAINSYAAARLSGDNTLINFAGGQLNAVITALFEPQPDEILEVEFEDGAVGEVRPIDGERN